jgi:hypothetical protein
VCNAINRFFFCFFFLFCFFFFYYFFFSIHFSTYTAPFSVTDFEYTPEMSCFDLLDMDLRHGWLLDAQDTETAAVVQSLSYNQLVEKVIDYQSSVSTSPPPPTCAQAKEEDQDVKDGGEEDGGKDSTGEADLIDLNWGDGDGGSGAGASDAAGVGAAKEEDAKAGEAKHREDKGDAEGKGGGEGEGESKGEGKGEGKDGGSDSHPIDPAVTAMNTKRDTAIREGAIAQRFLTDTASQLTYYGLLELHEHVRDRELCVFFRNNHFSTLFKFEGALYLLVTDAGWYCYFHSCYCWCWYWYCCFYCYCYCATSASPTPVVFRQLQHRFRWHHYCWRSFWHIHIHIHNIHRVPIRERPDVGTVE